MVILRRVSGYGNQMSTVSEDLPQTIPGRLPQAGSSLDPGMQKLHCENQLSDLSI